MTENLREVHVLCDNIQIFNGCRIRIRGRMNMTLLPDFFLVDVYNPSKSDLPVVKNFGTMTIRGKSNVLCSGEVEDVYMHRKGSNEIYSISVSDGQTFWEAKISSSVGPGALFSATVEHILTGAKMGSFLATDARFVRPQTFNGRLADIVRDIAVGIHARAFISKNVLHVVENGRSESIVVVNSGEVIANPNSATGVTILRTEVKGWPVGMLVNYLGKNYRLVSQEINADSFEGTWETELTLVDESYLDENGMDGG